MSATDLAELTAKLNEAKSDFEEAALLNALAR